MPDAVGAPFDRIRAILEMLDRLREKFPKLSLADLIAIATAAGKLLPLPDLADEAGCRQWCRMAVAVMDEVSQLTTVTIDDQVVDALLNIVESDDLWGLVWRIVEWVVPDNEGLVTGTHPPVLGELGERLGIDWTKLAVLIQAIIDFIKTWKS